MPELAFMLLGLGFFLFAVKMVLMENDKEYNRKLSEQREFGYPAIREKREKR